MKLASARGTITIDGSKFAYMIVFEEWNIKKGCYETSVYRRTNDTKTANRALKNLIAKHQEPLAEWQYKFDPDADKHRPHSERIIEGGK